MTASAEPAGTALSKADERRTFGVALGAHALHDGYSDLIYVLLPIWQSEFGLGYAAVGLMRAVLAGSMATFQIPAAHLGDRLGAVAVLAGGTALAGLSFCLAGFSVGIVSLVAVLLLAGIGASTQHPIGSALVARAFEGARSRVALGTYNFAGDLGKMALPASAALLISVIPWRPSLIVLGVFGLIVAAAIVVATPATASSLHVRAETGPGEVQRNEALSTGFLLLLAIGVIDSATRMAFLTFLPFLLTMQGADLPIIGLALTLVFTGGAAGKLVCGFLGARIGVLATVCLTEGLTAAGILLLPMLPLTACLLLLPLVGVALNGTSSVLYGSVPELVTPTARTRAFGIFYTATIGAGAAAPIFYGLAGDALGVARTMVLIALVVLATLPLAFALNPRLARG
jgi:MFS family permease